MNLKNCEKKEKNVAEIIIEVSAEEFGPAMDEAYKKNRSRISVPGFRKGKAPRKIIEAMYGASVFYNDALDILLPSVLNHAVKETELRLVSFPRVSDVDIKDDGGAVFTITAAVYPEITLGDYKGVSAEKPSVEVPDSAIDSELAAVQLRNARIETATRPAIGGDTAIIDFEGFIDGVPFDGGKGEKYELVLGSNSFIPGFEEKIQGMSAGEERDLDLVFPENYTEHLAGKAVVFKVKLHEVKEKLMPELDDEFAKDVSEFDTLAEYKADIRAKLENDKKTESDNAFENALMDKIILTLEGDIPDAMVEEYMDNSMDNFSRQISSYGMDPGMYLQMMNTTPEAFRENMRSSSERQVKVMLALEKIAELEGIEISDDEVENEYKEAAERYGAELEDFKESVSKEALIRDVKMRRAAKVVTDNAVAEAPEEKTESTDEAAAEPETAKPVEKKPAAKKPAAKKAEEPEAEEKEVKPAE